MRAVVTRVTEASVVIEGKTVGSIQKGFLVLLGVAPEDTEAEAIRLADKVCGCRVFEDENGKMNLNLETAGGDLLIISQFTYVCFIMESKHGRRYFSPLYTGIIILIRGFSILRSFKNGLRKITCQRVSLI